MIVAVAIWHRYETDKLDQSGSKEIKLHNKKREEQGID